MNYAADDAPVVRGAPGRFFGSSGSIADHCRSFSQNSLLIILSLYWIRTLELPSEVVVFYSVIRLRYSPARACSLATFNPGKKVINVIFRGRRECVLVKL